MLGRLMSILRSQIGRTATEIHDKDTYDLERMQSLDMPVEIVICTDEKKLKVGEKRNLLLKAATGSYVSFVDDDDIVSDDYVSELLTAMKSDCDIIVFDVIMYQNGKKMFDVSYDKDYRRDYSEGNQAFRLPNHIMCFKSSIAKGHEFMKINYGEDGIWARKVNRRIKTQHRIDKVLYYYYFDTELSETYNK